MSQCDLNSGNCRHPFARRSRIWDISRHFRANFGYESVFVNDTQNGRSFRQGAKGTDLI